MYPTAILMGISQTIALNTSMNLTGEVIGVKSDQGAFVWGFYSFLSKFSNGVIIYYILQSDYFQE
jgi:hypothetical protein